MQEDPPNYSYFVNKKCEYFPCHEGLEKEEFSCLFCFCPAFWACGIKSDGLDCPDCTLPHDRNMYPVMMKYLKNELKKKKDENPCL